MKKAIIDELIKEAEKKYQKGTIYKPISLLNPTMNHPSQTSSGSILYTIIDGKNGSFALYNDKNTGYIYTDGKWAEITGTEYFSLDDARKIIYMD